MDGSARVVATRFNAEPFLFPNDLCLGPDGTLYLADSGVSIDNFPPNNQTRPDCMDAHNDVRGYRAERTPATLLGSTRGFALTNGIVFGPDRLLYVNDAYQKYLLAWPVQWPGFIFPRAVRKRSQRQIETFPILRDGPPLMGWAEIG